jgi:hypothetical protein
VDNALSLLSTAIAPHMRQLLSAMDAPTAAQRSRITADDAIGPVDVLYEFGELDALTAPEKLTRPVLLFGAMTSFVGNTIGPKTAKWREQTMSESLHAVLEASEPSTGMRWCRTLFLRHGTEDQLAGDVKALHDALSGLPPSRSSSSQFNNDNDNDYNDNNDNDNNNNNPSTTYNFNLQPQTASNESQLVAAVAVVNRLQQLYVKLWFHLRRIVHKVFLANHDVLDAGTEIQVTNMPTNLNCIAFHYNILHHMRNTTLNKQLMIS